MASFEDVRAVDGGGGRPELEVPYPELDGEVVVEVGRGKFEEVAAEGAYPREDEGGGSEGGGQEGQSWDAERTKCKRGGGDLVLIDMSVRGMHADVEEADTFPQVGKGRWVGLSLARSVSPTTTSDQALPTGNK
mmetsp:Transcript_17967/g.37434  ORF Transcript_17967/g.37434 Transcript_17967/m.37434 type:complete len:134 (-) Transcript_17967:116-517(-)|eukprot:CAMPEP_0171371746 /NCGR_PEP_ID=MMETSP0879-20121228/8835_1 /TAXON_ID=67004 /ORGANISM="Thalassiosira weissflogii, Strain CCMP1336" /LENGTH=133 /DNA_ID=CAMNT_0011880385 /DNA_START=788 /DNA_END=1189 /DNA_ORIENTATION=-